MQPNQKLSGCLNHIKGTIILLLLLLLLLSSSSSKPKTHVMYFTSNRTMIKIETNTVNGKWRGCDVPKSPASTASKYHVIMLKRMTSMVSIISVCDIVKSPLTTLNSFRFDHRKPKPTRYNEANEVLYNRMCFHNNILIILCEAKNCNVYFCNSFVIYYDNFRHTHISVNFLSPVGYSVFFYIIRDEKPT